MKKNQIIALILIISYLYNASVYGLGMMDYYRSLKNDDISKISFSFSFYFTPVLYLFNLTAVLQFIISRFRKSILLRIALLYGIFSSVIFFPIWTVDSFFTTDVNRPQEHGAFFMISYVLNFLMSAFNIYLLRYLVSPIKAQLVPFGDGTHTFDEVGKWQRFFHRILDLIMISLAIYPSLSYIGRFLGGIIERSNFLASTVGRLLEWDQSHYILAYSFITLYYLVTEGIFNTTIGKTILGNVVVNEVAEKPGIGKRIGRSFVRLLPFEAFSFIFLHRGWHDSLTQTYVVKADKSLKNGDL